MTLCWTGGAGFIIKTDSVTAGIDLYLSNALMGADGSYKRLVPPPIQPESLPLDCLIASHGHGDHLDTGSVNKTIRADNETVLVCPDSAALEAEKAGVDKGRIIRLNRGETLDLPGLHIQAVMADHGELSPDAVGFILHIEGKVIYFTGDTCFRTDFPRLVPLPEKIDLLLVPINGKYGNPNSLEAAYFVQMLKPGVTVPCHYWLFAEHGGDPGEFISCCSRIAPGAKILTAAIGEEIVI